VPLPRQARAGADEHNHDTNEIFILMTGVWRCSCENEAGQMESIDLNPLDVISFPPGATRRLKPNSPIRP
jgi:cupin superfamily acireductone dioxygenase involved in methionine salvage